MQRFFGGAPIRNDAQRLVPLSAILKGTRHNFCIPFWHLCRAGTSKTLDTQKRKKIHRNVLTLHPQFNATTGMGVYAVMFKFVLAFCGYLRYDSNRCAEFITHLRCFNLRFI